MDKVSGTFTVIFENPFWIGIFESESKKTMKLQKSYLESNLQMLNYMNSY